MWYACVRRDMHAGFSWESLGERDFLGDLGLFGIVASKYVSNTPN